MFKRLFRILIIPLLFVGLDVFVRSEFIGLYQHKQVLFYFISMLISISYFAFVLHLLKRIEQRKWLFAVSIVFFVFPLIFAFIGSILFYRLNGLFPNYYTFLYIKTEPKSALMLLRDAIGWKEFFIFFIFGLGSFILLRFYIKKFIPEISKRSIYLWFFAQLIAFEGLTYFHQQFDQCAVVDVNVAACIQRNVFTWDDHSTYKGKGLSSHQPLPLEKCARNTDLNVLVIVFESLRKKSMQLYGNKRQTSPCLSEFARDNASDFYRFKQTVSIASTTMLAVPAILTGIAPYQDTSLLYHQPMIFQMGQQLNYHTFLLSSHTMHWYRFDRFYSKTNLDYRWDKDLTGLPYFNDLGVDDQLTVEAFKKHVTRIKSPFLGVLQLNATHYPYHVPQKWNKWTSSFKDSYDNAVRYEDALIGEVLDHLKKMGFLNNTAIFFVSDHGESLMEHRNIGHVESNYTEAIGVPMMAYIPKKYLSKTQRIALRSNTNQLTSNIDIAPSILALLHLDTNPNWAHFRTNFSGFNLTEVIPNERILISLNNNQVAHFNTGISLAHKKWHYLFRTNVVPKRHEFYWWYKDLGEWRNQYQKMPLAIKHRIEKCIKQYPVCQKFERTFKTVE